MLELYYFALENTNMHETKMSKRKATDDGVRYLWCEQWETDPEFKDWLAYYSTTKFRCNWCDKNYDYSNMGRSALVSRVRDNKIIWLINLLISHPQKAAAFLHHL